MRPPGPGRQVVAVLQLRSSSLEPAARRRVRIAMAGVPLLVVAAVVAGASASDRVLPQTRSDSLLLLPTAFLAFGVAALIAAIASSGGREMLPRSQLAALPVSPTADHLGAVLLAPLNLAWVLQAVALLGLVGLGVGWTPGLVAAVVTTLAWALAATVVAQTVAWVVELLRTAPGGVWIVRVTAAALAGAAVALSSTGGLVSLLDNSPTVHIVIQVVQGSEGDWTPWLKGLAELALASALALAVGGSLATVISRRPHRDSGRVETRTYPARADLRSDVVAVLRVDRASVWRSTPLRRGLVVLALVPGASAAIARLPWEVLPLLPGLVASGACLLFGVNALSLDSGGTVWRESLPLRSRTWLIARALVIVEVAAASTLLALAVSAARAPEPPTVAAGVAVVTAVVVICAQVLARCLQWSLHRPYRADLRGARDAPAPPAAMAWYSARLALSTTLVGMVLSLAARAPSPTWALAVGLPVLLLALRRVMVSLREWEDPDIRSLVVTTVAGG